MNSLYAVGVRQTSSIEADLEKLKLGESSASLNGQIAASLAALHRTIEDYASIARREIIKAKQEKAEMRLQKFRNDYNELMRQFEQLKKEQELSHEVNQMSTATPSTGTARQRFSSGLGRGSASLDIVSESPFRGTTPTTLDRQAFALREDSFIQNAETRLDEYLAQGREVLDNLVDQRHILKGTQRRILDTAHTLGLSRNVIGWIERRSRQDMYIFFGGAVFTFFCFYLIWRYFG